MIVRVKFAKYGPLRFTGHLDVLRFFQKAIRRAGLDVVYTHGFNPHQVMSFAAPLGVGLCSVGEYMDVEIAASAGGMSLRNRYPECKDAAGKGGKRDGERRCGNLCSSI